MTDLSSRRILGLNQQTYQRLRVALSLSLRRQIFIAVCDDLPLRDRLVAQLETDLSTMKGRSGFPASRLETVTLDLDNPSLLAPVAQWISDHAPQQSDRSTLPAFQIVGIEQLTRQPAAQRLFFEQLQGIERSLTGLESTLLIWLTQPWLKALPQSAPEFWRCRTGVFEFVGSPTPARRRPPTPPPVDRKPQKQSPPPTAHPSAGNGATLPAPPAPPPKPTPPPKPATPPSNPEPPAIKTEPPAAKPVPSVAIVPAKTESRLAPQNTSTQALENLLPDALKPLLRQIEMLHQQQAPPAVLANAYRALGNMFRDRIEQGEGTPQNLMIAIAAYEQVLHWLEDTSALWVDILNDLGNLYWMRSRSTVQPEEALSFVHRGVKAYQLALTKLNAAEVTPAYPMVQNNLGAAYADLARYEDPAENLQRSVQAYQQALRYRTPDAEPLRYASTQNNLGTTFWNLAQYQQPVDYLKQAISAYSEALRFYSPESDPVNYAMIQNNLGTAYWNLAQHDRPQDWLMLALSAYRKALQYRTLEANPIAYAATQNNLGTAFWHLATQLKEDTETRLSYLQAAIDAYEATLNAVEQIGSPVPLNFDLFATHNNLGLAHFQFATDVRNAIDKATLSGHLEQALHHHLQALQGWQNRFDLHQTALACVLQTVRAFHEHLGLSGQNRALSMVPGHLLPDLLPQL